jgi:hypothetical protein
VLASERDADFVIVIGMKIVELTALFVGAKSESEPAPVSAVDVITVSIGSWMAPTSESVPEFDRKSPLPEIGAPSVRLL